MYLCGQARLLYIPVEEDPNSVASILDNNPTYVSFDIFIVTTRHVPQRFITTNVNCQQAAWLTTVREIPVDLSF